MTAAPSAAAAASAGPRVSLESIVRLTYQNNLQVAIERFDLESAELQFERFIRNQSSFTPFILDSQVEREVESELDDGIRETQRADSGQVSVGLEKEFFDGSAIEAAAGINGNRSRGGTTSNPFIELGAEVPLFGSFTRLERTIERTFEESELFNAWLDYLNGVRGTISESLRSYLFLQQNFGSRDALERVIADLRALEREPRVTERPNDLAQVRDQIQAYQSELAGEQGGIDSARIGLLDSIGLEALELGQIEPMDVYAQTYGAGYLTQPIEAVISEAIRNDVEIQVLEVARRNEDLKRDLALRGKWDITGRVNGGYDFERRGDDARPRGYQLGVGVSVRRNDPRLLQLSLRQSQAEIRKLDAEIAHRRRELTNDIRQNLVQAASARRVVAELTSGRESRRGVYQQKLAAYRAGTDTVDNLIEARNQLFETEGELLEELIEFYEIVLDLDETSGRYFVILGDLIPTFESLDPAKRGARPATP